MIWIRTVSFAQAGGLEDFGTIDTRKVLNIIALVVSLGVIIYGSIKFGWDMPEMAAMFIWLAIVVGIISGFDSDTICKNFLEGCKKMMSCYDHHRPGPVHQLHHV